MIREEHQPRHWYTTNLVGVPTRWLASTGFQQSPRPLSIAGALASHKGLFALLARSPDAAEAREVFSHYMSLAFGLRPDGDATPARPATAARGRWRAHYLKLLQGWGMDANGAAGAVLKGWVESRFGLVPTWHREPLARFPSPAWVGYLEDKAASRWHNNAIWQQLDLLYEYAQWMLRHHLRLPGTEGERVRLWRGSTRAGEQIVAGSLRERQCVVRLNNLVSFSLSREAADCFGDWVFETWVPLSKLLYAPGLLRSTVLQGEGEVIALGGDYQVEARYAA